MAIGNFRRNCLCTYHLSHEMSADGADADADPEQPGVLVRADELFWHAQVAQLSGFVSADTAYHHGETSLQSTIIGLAHNFIGSNNVNVLVPAGEAPPLLVPISSHAQFPDVTGHHASPLLCKVVGGKVMGWICALRNSTASPGHSLKDGDAPVCWQVTSRPSGI